ncbi:MAG: zf-HC2 domain-containing protein [Propionibacteriaceae bacterium]|jgi:anti-sigma factor (TIGR02949 family)|nr:zf-HC2 domain-containing protein [Propionibacteriaceae bacterium]
MMGTLGANDLDETACQHVQERVHLFLDQELDEDAADEIRRHVVACERCTDELNVWITLRRLLKRAHHPTSAPEALIRRIADQIQQADEDGLADCPHEVAAFPAIPVT